MKCFDLESWPHPRRSLHGKNCQPIELKTIPVLVVEDLNALLDDGAWVEIPLSSHYFWVKIAEVAVHSGSTMVGKSPRHEASKGSNLDRNFSLASSGFL